jgi:nitroreductase
VTLPLTPDQLLSTTRAVRRRLDLSRPVPDQLIRECVALALQAPSGGNEVVIRFVVVRDPARIAAVGEVYARAWAMYAASPAFAGRLARTTGELRAQQERSMASSRWLGEHMGQVPALVIACRSQRIEGGPSSPASAYGSVLPAMWSFMLAARARGLGTVWTTMHLKLEAKVAALLDIPAEWQQVCMTPVAFTVGTDFKPALRPEPDTVIEWR